MAVRLDDAVILQHCAEMLEDAAANQTGLSVRHLGEEEDDAARIRARMSSLRVVRRRRQNLADSDTADVTIAVDVTVSERATDASSGAIGSVAAAVSHAFDKILKRHTTTGQRLQTLEPIVEFEEVDEGLLGLRVARVTVSAVAQRDSGETRQNFVV